MAFTTVQYIRQVAVASVPVAGTTQYTVPASRQDVVKCMALTNTTAAAINITINFAGVSGLTATIPTGQSLTWTGTIVMNAGETIVTAATAVGLTLLISGLESQ